LKHGCSVWLAEFEADVETLPPCKKRDDLVQKLREIETAVDFN